MDKYKNVPELPLLMKSQKKGFSGKTIKIVLIGFILLWLATYPIVNNSNGYNKLMVEISIGLLAFIGIFYSLIFRKDVDKKRDEMIASELGNFCISSTKILKDINPAQNENLNQNKIKNRLRVLSEELDSISLFVAETDMKRQLMISAVSLILTSIITFTDFLFPAGVRIFTTLIIFRNFAYIFFLVGLYKSLELLSTWYFITERDYQV